MRADVVSHCLLSFFHLPFMRDSIFVIALLQDTLGDIFFSFFPPHVPPELSKVPPHRRRVQYRWSHLVIVKLPLIFPLNPSEWCKGGCCWGAVALYYRRCWTIAEPAVGHTASRPFPSVSKKERSETMHFTVSVPSLGPSFHTPHLIWL